MMVRAGRILPLVLLSLWEVCCRVGLIDAQLLPGPSAIIISLASPGLARDLLGQMGHTSLRIIGGFLMGGGAGFSLGLSCGAFRRLDEALLPLIDILRPIPSVAVIPVAVIFLGLGDAMNMAVAAFACTWPVLVAVRDAVNAIDPILLDTARIYGMTKGRTLWLVVLPASLPGAVTGLRAALGIAAAVAISGEMVASSNGLGYLAISSLYARQLPLAWAAVLAMGLVGAALMLCFSCLLGQVARFHPGLLGLPGNEGKKP